MAAAISDRFAAVRAELARACVAAGRDPGDVRLLAVSKTQPLSSIVEALQSAQLDFGENYAQELRDKSAALASDSRLGESAKNVRWHFIGPLQRNKVNLVAGRVSLIHSVDSLALVAALAGRITRLRESDSTLTQDCLIEVNVGDESQKAGCSPSELAPILDAIAASEGRLRCRGLMCLPPQVDEPEAVRPYFRKLRELAQNAAQTPRPHVELRELSMGMSHDFPVAVAEGATIVRVGTALFGARGPA